MLFSAATRDERVARQFEAFGSRNIGPARMFASTLPRVALRSVRARRSLSETVLLQRPQQRERARARPPR